MSLAAALKKGLETADTIGNWDPFADEAKSKAAPRAPVTAASTPALTGPANTNAAARALAARDGGTARSPIAAVRETVKTAPAVRPKAVAAAAPAPARPGGTAQERIAARQAGQKGAAKPAQRANWLHDAMPGGRVNAAQYVRELDRFASEENRRAVSDVVMEVNQSEVEGVVRHAARIKGRYLAKLLDLGNKSKSGVMEAEVSELTRYRETYEELARGLDILKSAIEAGDISVSGTVRR
ncbi:hypothetical protein T8K17_20680 [Thalassobaculum sp. OXR-137]|uniref:hypothetical protein n=1 Tax=Thalassobaculum sp. OXR-137 TaxID=3100173 RepID=UPI002AC9E964|nr:hypothetical protein [Thalassobaculum sp. OXR-137]WPZ33639.1 hypothetical protein T8K17_20680 [Thalassobaculum sp. OXR-137]